MPDAAPLAYVVLLNTNGWTDTEPCLRSLESLEYPNHRIVVVDNGSSDRSEELIRAGFPRVEVLQAGGNVGFSRGNNLGVRHALREGAGYVWLLNNDTLVTPGALSELVAEAERDPRAGIVGSALYFEDERDRIQAWGGGTFDQWRGVTACAMVRTSAADLDFVTGASMLLRRAFLEDVGLLDESFFLYMEDVDLSYRARANGWSLRIAERSVVFHKVGRTINRGGKERSLQADLVHVRSAGIFLGKHAGAALPLVALLRLAGIVARRAARWQLRPLPALVREFVSGVRTGVSGGGEARAPAGAPEPIGPREPSVSG